MKPHAFHHDARQELVEAVRYYTHISPELGSRFYDEINRLALDIQSEPERYPLFDPPIRRHFSNVFPYAALYVEQPDRVLIIAVMHMKRHPDYWRGRLR